MARARKIGKTWRAIWQLPEFAPDGRHHKEGSESGFRTKSAAEDYAEAQEAAIRAGTWVDPERGKITLDAYWAEWIDVQRLSDSTRDRYDGYYRNHLGAEWGDDAIASIDVLAVDRLKKKLLEEKRLASATADAIIELLGRMLGDAAFGRRIGHSPVRPKTRRGERVVNEDKRVGIAITVEQVLAICDRLPGPEALLALTAAFTGMRWGEAAGMRRRFLFLQPAADGTPACGWYEIDKKVGALKERRGNLSFGPPKTREERTVQLPPFLVLLLLAHLETLPAKQQLLFPCSSGEGYRRGNFGRQYWRPACDGWPARPTRRGHAALEAAASIVKTLRFHDLRHSQETWMTEDHIPRIARDARLGHTTPGMEGTYNHVTPPMQQQILDSLEARFASARAVSGHWT